MTEPIKRLHGAVITDPRLRTHGIIQLLSYHVRGKIDLTYYEHPNQIEIERAPHFIIVMTVDDITGVLRHYRAKEHTPPMIVHLDRPETLGAVDYANTFPGVQVVPVEQALMHEKDVTLQIGMFQRIVETLESSV